MDEEHSYLAKPIKEAHPVHPQEKVLEQPLSSQGVGIGQVQKSTVGQAYAEDAPEGQVESREDGVMRFPIKRPRKYTFCEVCVIAFCVAIITVCVMDLFI